MTSLNRIIKGGVLALSFALATGSASAANYTFGTINPGDTRAQVASSSPGAFSDNFSFAITQSGPNGTYSYFNFLTIFGGVTLSNISNAVLTLTGPSGLTTSLMNGEIGIALLAGNYNANVSGMATGTGGGAYEFNITAPTPEPAVWLTMLLGASMIGFAVRRRKSTLRPGLLLPA